MTVTLSRCGRLRALGVRVLRDRDTSRGENRISQLPAEERPANLEYTPFSRTHNEQMRFVNSSPLLSFSPVAL